MADLPIELWHSIFDCPGDRAFTRPANDWFHPDFSIYRHRVDYSVASMLERSSFNLENLRRLKIGRFSSIDDLNVINKFAHLKELDIDLANYKSERRRALSLANLKVLHLFMSDHLSYLELDTPRLAKVYTFSLKKLDFLRFIRHLRSN